MNGRSYVSGERVEHANKRLGRVVAVACLLLAALTVAQAQGSVSAAYTGSRVQAPQTVAGLGFRSVELKNHGATKVTFDIYRLLPGTSLADFSAASIALHEAIQGGAPTAPALQRMTALAVPVGTSSVSPHQSAALFVDFALGDYAVAATPAGDPGGASFATFHATPGGESAGAPVPSHNLTVSDASVGSSTSVAAGKNLWAITNRGSRVHLVKLYRLLPNRTAAELQAYLDGSQPGLSKPYDKTSVAGPVAPGSTIYVTLDLAAGKWVGRTVTDHQSASVRPAGGLNHLLRYG